MMTNRVDSDERNFEAIARAFLEERAQRHGNSLRRFIERYPEYEEELVLLAAEMAASDGEMAIPVTPPSHLFQRLRAEARAVLTPDAEPQLESLRDQAKRQAGLTLPALAAQLGIGVDVLAMLEERQIVLSSIPAQFLDHMAKTLRTSQEALLRFLTGSAGPSAPQVAYHAPQGHVDTEPLTFAEAISTSDLMTDEEKARWLQYVPTNGDL